MARLFISLLFTIAANIAFSQSLQIVGFDYTEDLSGGIVFDLPIMNQSLESDTLSSIALIIDMVSIYYNFPEDIIFQPSETKIITPEVCFHYNANTITTTIIEIPGVPGIVNNVISSGECPDSNFDGICDNCNQFMPPLDNLESHLDVININNKEFFDSFNIDHIDVYNLNGQRIQNSNASELKIVVVYFKNNDVKTYKVY